MKSNYGDNQISAIPLAELFDRAGLVICTFRVIAVLHDFYAAKCTHLRLFLRKLKYLYPSPLNKSSWGEDKSPGFS